MNASFVIMGLPASGKTTFLAALWHLIESEETDCRLTLDGYRGDLAYLNKISEAWRTFQKVPRTSHVGDMNVTINLRNRETGVRGMAYFPDLAGEVFDRQIVERRCRPEFLKEVSEDDGILFFVSADVKEDNLSVVELNARLPDGDPTELGSGEADLGAEGNSSNPIHGREWEPKLLPAQVKIVQLLSDLLRPPFEPRCRRLAVLISAWDLARGMELTPRLWLARHMPLVDQFLRANVTSFRHEVYGVSAQGVDLEDTPAVDEAAKLMPSRRIQIVGPESDGNDLTVPLVWLMSAGE